MPDSPGTPHVRTIRDVDRDLDGFRRQRGRHQTMIEEYLLAVAVLRTQYARAGTRMDVLLEERLTFTRKP